jgi:hypothetical protein
MARVWPDRIVEENSLRSQISALRTALGAERELIRTVPGRGYQFTGETRILPASPDERAGAGVAGVQPRSALPPTNLPQAVSELIGRDDDLGEILSLATAHRLVTLTGAGGIGKTRLALAAARQLLPHFADGVWLAELSPLADPSLVPTTVAAAVGLEPAAYGGIDILVNNVGGGGGGARVADSSDDDWRVALERNLIQTARMMRLALPCMKERPGAAVINIASSSGWSPRLAMSTAGPWRQAGGSFFTLSKRKGLPASFRLKTARSTTSRTKERPETSRSF